MLAEHCGWGAGKSLVLKMETATDIQRTAMYHYVASSSPDTFSRFQAGLSKLINFNIVTFNVKEADVRILSFI